MASEYLQSRHVQALAPWADAVVVGSALIDLVERYAFGRAERKAVKEFVAGLKAAPSEKEEGLNMAMVCRGIRGATTADENSKEAIIEATKELLAGVVESQLLQH